MSDRTTWREGLQQCQVRKRLRTMQTWLLARTQKTYIYCVRTFSYQRCPVWKPSCRISSYDIQRRLACETQGIFSAPAAVSEHFHIILRQGAQLVYKGDRKFCFLWHVYCTHRVSACSVRTDCAGVSLLYILYLYISWHKHEDMLLSKLTSYIYTSTGSQWNILPRSSCKT